MPGRARLDKGRVVQAAIDLINMEGLDALSLSHLARRLGIRTPSLYNHVDGLPGLENELAIENARRLGLCLGEAAIARSGTQALRAIATAYREYIKANRGLYLASLRASRNRETLDPELVRYEGGAVEVVMAVIASFGYQGDEALHIVRGLRSLVHGFASLEIAGGFGLPLDLDESFHRLVDTFILGLQAHEGEK